MQGLNERQEEACSYVDGPLLLLAGAGSGKTRVITHRIAYLIDECNVNPYNILAITFTNKAANEMRERVDRLVGYGSESVWVSTFHSMCVRILRRFYERLGGSNNFSIYDTDDQKTVVREATRSLGLDTKLYPEKGVIAFISKAKEEYQSPDDMERCASDFRSTNLAKIYREYQKRMIKNNALDFDDLIVKTIQLFERNPDVLEIYQERFRYIMVDEYQDTNHTQFILVKMLADKYKNLCVVGDDDQSIYKFRGADISNILDFESVYPNAKVIKLEQNYRSTSNILNAANAVIKNNKGRKEKHLWTEKGDGTRVVYTRYENEFIEAEKVMDKIMSLNVNGIPLSDMAILYRTNNQSRVLEEKMIMANIPYKIYGGQNFYARKEIKDILCYLKIVDNSADGSSLKRIINVPRRGIGDTTVERISQFAAHNDMSMYDAMHEVDSIPELSRAAAKIHDFMNLIRGFKRTYIEDGMTELFDQILEKTGYKNELILEGTDEAKGRIENLNEFRNKIVQYEQGAEEPTLTGLLEEVALVADTDSDDVDTENGHVSLMTLHSAKGLEFPYLFIVGMEERLFPSGMAIDSDDPDAVEEERRLCYVGITRAMKELYLSSAGSRMLNGTRTFTEASRFIEEIPEELLETRDESPRRRSSAYGDGYSKRDSFDSYGGGYVYGGSSAGASGKTKSYGSGNSGFKGVNPYKTVNAVKKETGSSGTSSAGGFSVDYAVGDTVRHIKFGNGVVKELVKTGNEYEVTVDFSRVGEKRMFASLAKLKKV